jgi:tetratricopeptide (TPR) repeat protein
MHPTATILLSVTVATAAAIGTSFVFRPSDPPVDPAAIDLRRTLDELRAEQRALQQRLAALASGPQAATASLPAPERTAVPQLDAAQVAAAVEAYLQQRSGGAATAANASANAAAFDLDSDFAKLVGTSYWEDPTGWKKAFAAGRMDDVVKQFEALAKQSPNDPAVQMNLANAYLAHLQLDQSKWQLSMKADTVFDKVLDLDERHWEARFSKAMSYTFWPDFLGKKKDAIGHFETLVAQQESMPVEASHAQTYLYLGNLLEARDPQKAREMWAKGARRHPDNQELAKKAGN